MARDAETVERLQKQLRAMRESRRRKQQTRRREREARLKREREAKKLAWLREDDLRRQIECKDAELAELRCQPESSRGCIAEGSIQLDVELEVVKKRKSSSSPLISIGGCSFHVTCGTMSGCSDPAVCISFHCQGDAEGAKYAADVGYTLRLASSKEPRISGPKSFCFTRESRDYRYLTILLSELEDPANKFLRYGRLTINADIKLLSYEANAFANFSIPGPLSDVTLIMDGQKIHGNKMFLAHFSGYFKDLFFSNLAEKDKTEYHIWLPDFEVHDFKELLKMIHPIKIKREPAIDEDNIASILCLADFFDMPSVIWKCSEFLKVDDRIEITKTLKLAVQYRLHEVLFHWLTYFDGDDDKEELGKYTIESDCFKTYPEWLQNAILMKHFNRKKSAKST